MKLHHTLCTALSVTIFGISTLLVATPASAATTPSSITISACNSGTPSATVSTSSVSWTSASDTLSVSNQCSTGVGGTSMPIQVWGLRNSAELLLATVTNGSTLSTSALGSDVTQIRIYDFTGFSARGPLLATVTASSPSTGGGGSSTEAASSSAPPPIFQQFGQASSGTCEAVAPASLNWSGVASGGWSESWAQWMNDGRGGAVCTRTLVFSTSMGAWTVG